MHRVRKVICSVVIGFVAFAVISCCCTPAVAQAFAASSSEHACCPTKANPDHQYPQCQYQLSQAEKAGLHSYELYSLEKVGHLYISARQSFISDFSSFTVLAILNGPPEGVAVPLYLQSHKLRL